MPSLFCEMCITRLIERQWPLYEESLATATCKVRCSLCAVLTVCRRQPLCPLSMAGYCLLQCLRQQMDMNETNSHKAFSNSTPRLIDGEQNRACVCVTPSCLRKRYDYTTPVFFCFF